MQTLEVCAVIIQLICCLASHAMTMRSTEYPRSNVCRDRLGYFTPKDYKISSCSMCYFYLVVQSPKFTLNREITVQQLHTEPFLLRSNTSVGQNSPNIYPAFDNQTAIDIICDTLDDVMCNGWVTCCKAAWDCCMNQIESKPTEEGPMYCPQTFDGWDCWEYSPPNRTVKRLCPSFLSSPKGANSSKVCGADGNWQIDSGTGLEYTEYDSCSNTDSKQTYRTPIIVGLGLNITGMILVIPAITIYTMYRSLRKQHRIKIHINFFLSIFITSALCMVWDITVRLDRLATDQDHSFLHAHQSTCKCLHVLHRFARASMFFWMSCEGFFLHRLLVKAFSPPKRFYGYALYGWGCPILLLCIYSSLRKLFADDSVCWILPLKAANIALDWVLIYSPTIACIVMNTIFLLSILRLLLKKTTKHPNEPSNFRKIMKAAFILVPLFGIHQFCLIYRPDPDLEPGYEIYEVTSAIILNSQGIISSLLFCYFNAEVQSHIKLTFKKLGRRYSHRRTKDGRKLSLSLTMTSRRTSVSSLQNGGLGALSSTEPANRTPFHGFGVTTYGTGSVSESNLGVRDNGNGDSSYHNREAKADTNIGADNPSFLNDEASQQSVRL